MMAYTDSYGPDPDGDPIQSSNGGDILDVHLVCTDDSNGNVPSAQPPSVGSGAGVNPGPCR